MFLCLLQPSGCAAQSSAAPRRLVTCLCGGAVVFCNPEVAQRIGLVAFGNTKKNAADCIFLVTFLVSYRCKFAFSSFWRRGPSLGARTGRLHVRFLKGKRSKSQFCGFGAEIWGSNCCAAACWCVLVCAGVCWCVLVCAGVCWCHLHVPAVVPRVRSAVPG